MDLFTLFTLAVGLSMDAFAVSICKGLSMEKLSIKNMAVVGLWFGGFQALMPVIGYLLGVQFKDKITAIDHWIAFILLGFIGVNMIRESLDKEESCPVAGVDARPCFLWLWQPALMHWRWGSPSPFWMWRLCRRPASSVLSHLSVPSLG